jgi:tetratricopeptide (TPR) repeat protein
MLRYKNIVVLLSVCFLQISTSFSFAQKESSDSLKTIFLDATNNPQTRIEIGTKLVKEITVIEDNITINKETEHLILTYTNPTSLKVNLTNLFDVMIMRSVLLKLGQNSDAALESMMAAQSIAKTIGDKELIAFTEASTLHQSIKLNILDSLSIINLSLYKIFLTQSKSLLAGLCLQNAGDIQYIKKNYSGAINYYKKSLSLQNVYHNKLIATLLNTQIGQCYLELGSNEIAMASLDAAYQMHLLEGNKEEQAINLYYIAKAHFNKKEIKTAEEIINKVRLVTSQLKDSYFKKLVAVQLSAMASLKQDEQIQKLFKDSTNLLNSASVLPMYNLSPSSNDMYLKNIELMKQSKETIVNTDTKKSNKSVLVYLLIALGGIIASFGILKFLKRKN